MRKKRGFSIAEVMVAASLALLLMTIIWAAMQVLTATRGNVQASQEPRKQLRAALSNLQSDLRRAAYLFPAGVYNVDGRTVSIPHPGDTGEGLAFAIPENSISPILYSVVVVSAQPRVQQDARTPDARSLVYFTSENNDPPLSDLPGELDLELLPTNGSLKVFDTYLSGSDGFQVEVTPNLQAVRMAFHIRRQEARGELQESRYQTTLALRNTL